MSTEAKPEEKPVEPRCVLRLRWKSGRQKDYVIAGLAKNHEWAASGLMEGKLDHFKFPDGRGVVYLDILKGTLESVEVMELPTEGLRLSEAFLGGDAPQAERPA
jgi:hypothetical protein